MRKKAGLIVLALLLAISVAAVAETTPNTLETSIEVMETYEANPVIEGESPLTGLPLTEAYTPLMIVLDNAEDAYPHWGVDDASVFFQVPNAGGGATKILALYGDAYPENAGGIRSARITMLPIANAFNAAIASGGYPNLSGSRIDMNSYMKKWNFAKGTKYFNLLGNSYKARETFVSSPHNLTGKVREIHDYLVESGVEFEKRPFKFTDEPLARGENAGKIKITHYVFKDQGRINNASYAEYEYEEGKGYSRTTATGLNKDRFTENPLYFSNLIVLRVEIGYQDSYPYLKANFTGKGAADIFQNGKYIQGAWVRSADDSRLVITDETGKELDFQRGKTFFVITNEITDVDYE